MKYLSNLDLNKNQLLKARLENLASDPNSPVTGQIYYNTTDNVAYIWNGSAWLSAAGASVVGGNLLSVTIDGQEYTVNHDSVSRTDTTSTASPQPDGTFTAVDSVTTSAEGHVTAINVKTVTLPSYGTSAVDVDGDATIRLTDTDGVEDDIAIVGGSQIDVVVTDASTITISHADTLGADSIEDLVTTEIFDGITVDANGHVTGLSTRNLTTADIGALDAGDLSVSGSTISSTETTITIDPASAGPGGTVVIAGNLTVQGTTTTIDSNEVNIGDSILVLNSDAEGAASANAGFEIERGDDDNVSFLWNETNDRFEMTNLDEPAAPYVVGRKYVKTIGAAQISGATATITHNLNTKDVFVSLREVASDEIVYATYDAATVDTLQIRFATAPSADAFIVTIIG
jgi:hypothetical protein